MQNLNIEFGGFYESDHSYLIDSMIENYFEEDENLDKYDIDYKLIYNAYIIKYLNNLDEFLRDTFYNIDTNIIKFHNSYLISPTYYNYSTDKINCNISNKNASTLIKTFKDNSDFLHYLQDATQGSDGYISFYTKKEVLENKDNMLLTFIFSYICSELFTGDNFTNYYDINNNDELLYSLEGWYNETN